MSGGVIEAVALAEERCCSADLFANNGNIFTITDTLNTAKNQTYTYDFLNRLVTGAQADNAFNISFNDDAWGNMKESGRSNFQPLFDSNNHMVPSGGCSPNLNPYCFDAAGNLLKDNLNHMYTYDGEARIKTVDGSGAAYTYNALGNRVRKDAAGTSTEYFLFGGNIIAELNPTTSAYTDYIFGYGGKRLAKDTSSNGGAAQYYQDDHLGTTRLMTDASGTPISNCTYAPYGEQVGCSLDNASNHYRFTGKERDTESGNDSFGKRYYSSTTGRWSSPDVVNVTEERQLNPANTLNKYAYGASNPLKYVDPDGQDVTYFYDPGGIAGHAVLFAYDQQNGDSALDSFGPGEHAPIWAGKSNFDMDEFHSAQGLRDNYAAITVQTTPEVAQQVIDYIRQHPDPSVWTVLGPNCSSVCANILRKFKLDNQSKWDVRQGLTPKVLWHSLMSRYNPSQNHWWATPQRGRDYGNSRFDMFGLLWNLIQQAQNATVTTTVTNCVTDKNGVRHCNSTSF